MTCNAAGLLFLSRKLALCNRLAANTVDNTVDVMAVTEVEIPASSAPFAMAGYVTFCPTMQPGKKTRFLVLVQEAIALESNAMPRLNIMLKNIMLKSSTTVWIELSSAPPHPRMLIGAAYRVWSGISQERDHHLALIDQL
jgi:hypothetical protein